MAGFFKGKKNRSNKSDTDLHPSVESDSVTNASGESDKPLMKRDAVICSTGHNAHLNEDYEQDETKLIGRKVGRRRNPKHSDKQSSIESQSLTSFPSDLTLSSQTSSDLPRSALSGTLKKHLQTVPEEGEARGANLPPAPSPTYSDLDPPSTPQSVRSVSWSPTKTPQEIRQKMGFLGRTWASEDRSHHVSNLASPLQGRRHNPLPANDPHLDFYDYAAGNKTRPVVDTYEPYTYLETPSQRPKLKKQHSLQSLSRGTDGRLLMARASVVHPMGEFDEPYDAYDAPPASYATAYDPKTGGTRLIRRDSVIHPTELESADDWVDRRHRRRNSIVRPLQMEKVVVGDGASVHGRPQLYKRQSLTHGDLNQPRPMEREDFERQREASIQRHLLNRPTPTRHIRDSVLSGSSPASSPDRLPAPKYINGRFEVPWETQHKPGLFDAIKWKLTSTDTSRVPKEDELNRVLPIVRPNFKLPIPENGIRVTWLGHSTVLIQMDKIVILTDPIFSERASPLWMMGPKRYRRPPCSINSLPHIDVVLISHNHYDHLDTETVRALNGRFGNDLHWFVPLGLQGWMTSVGCRTVYEMSWWEEIRPTHAKDICIAFTPAQHWCKRALTDENKVLWGSWCVIGPRHRFFFTGDTGYCEIFKWIGERYGPFDLAAIPIGAYEPRWFMKLQHVNPFEAVLIHEDVLARQSIGIHWGTFALTPEHYLAPRKNLAEALNRHGLPPHCFFTLSHGESKFISGNTET